MKRLIITSLCVLFASTTVFGDWTLGDDHKIHYPQLPDPFGWDVKAGFDSVTGLQKVLADDYSHPDDLLWERDFFGTEIVILDYGTGQQRWFNPNTDLVVENDHSTFHQINIENIVDPFIQDEGTIYWLDVTVFTHDDTGTVLPEWGWKSGSPHFNDDAVFGDYNAVGEVAFWKEL